MNSAVWESILSDGEFIMIIWMKSMFYFRWNINKMFLFDFFFWGIRYKQISLV